MMKLNEVLSEGIRPPPPEQIAGAFCDFFQARKEPKDRIEDIQAKHAMVAYKHLRETYHEVGDFGISDEDLRIALQTLGNISKGQGKFETHLELAGLLFEELKKRRQETVDGIHSGIPWAEVLFPFVRVLSNCGDTAYARRLVEQFWFTDLVHHHSHTWLQILGGFAREDTPEEIAKTIEIMQKYEVSFNSKVHQFITLHYAQRGDIERTKKWYRHPIADSKPPTFHTNSRILMFCIRYNELEWGDPIFKSMLERTPNSTKEWTLIFQWAAAKGRGVDEIDRMMKVMVRRTADKENPLHPDIEMINRLVELANSKDDSYSAERYVALGQKWGIQPDAQTWLLQLDYRIKVGDLDGARHSYNQLKMKEIPDNKDLPLINKLIVAMCAERQPNFTATMGLVEDLNERKARFESVTVGALCRLHFQRGEMPDLVDLLNTHVFHYSGDQRAAIRDILVEYCLDRSRSTAQAWDAYSILRQIFVETEPEIRTRIMNEFFSRKRSDLGCHVFGHMRQQTSRSQRPTVDTYAACFEGIAKSADTESLMTVHNMLKLDSGIEPNTKLYNSLMLAYTACDLPGRSLRFWADIVHSREGPTYSSIRIALRACEAKPFGDRDAREIWAKLKKFQIEVTREIYIAYLCALAGEALFEESIKLVDEAEKTIGHSPDTLM